MKILIDLPDWAEGRHITVFAGIEEIAHQHVGHPMMVKVDRCSRCGSCCQAADCEYLQNSVGHGGHICLIAKRMPFDCANSEGIQPGCNISWQVGE